MIIAPIAKACSGRLHYAWITLAVVFTAMLAGVGVRAAPGVMIVPLQQAFGRDAPSSCRGSSPPTRSAEPWRRSAPVPCAACPAAT
ncbi:hypothetical protein [Rhodopila sp.]|uniref:hypothetical protein n=1 Tax=Rhodopila sp. TaxID=2480087 RepID=UPI003D14D60D